MTKNNTLAICGICGCDPCDCHGVVKVEMVKLTYKVKGSAFTLVLPKRLVDQYKSLYDEIEVMQADGRVLVYSRGVVTEKNNENQ